MGMNYEVGKWAICKYPNEVIWYLFRISFVTDDYLYGVEHYNNNGSLVNLTKGSSRLFPVSNCLIATPSQIEQCLNAYAENNGYVEGVIVFDPIKGHNEQLWPNIIGAEYFENCDQLVNCGTTIYIKGKWAELVKEPETKEDLSIQCKTDDWGNYQLDSVHVIIRDKSVSLKELVSVYQQHLDIKTIIG
jgi:hypothetical protein